MATEALSASPLNISNGNHMNTALTAEWNFYMGQAALGRLLAANRDSNRALYISTAKRLLTEARAVRLELNGRQP